MTRKDYEAIAATIKQHAAPHNGQHLSWFKSLAVDVAEIMAADNPRFDRARFLKACGVQS
jgi:hypothetical protein